LCWIKQTLQTLIQLIINAQVDTIGDLASEPSVKAGRIDGCRKEALGGTYSPLEEVMKL
jgi:hypothetical protein